VVALPSGSPGVITYIVDELKYYPGSATLWGLFNQEVKNLSYDISRWSPRSCRG
jgi:hypothetical protein